MDERLNVEDKISLMNVLLRHQPIRLEVKVAAEPLVSSYRSGRCIF